MTGYEKYQLQWMIDHGFSLDDLISELTICQLNSNPKDSVRDIYENWERDQGFGSGSIWVCEEEWLQYEGANYENI